MNNREYKTGDLVIVVNDTRKECVGQEAEFIRYNDEGLIYASRYRYIVRILKYDVITAVLEIRPLTLLEIELNS